MSEFQSELYGLTVGAPDAVADRLGAALGWPVERHRSAYLGDPGDHPPEDRFLRPEFPTYDLLMSADLAPDDLVRFREALQGCFPETVLLPGRRGRAELGAAPDPALKDGPGW